MNRIPLKRTGWLRRFTKLPWRSKKRQREDVEYRRFKAERMAEHPLCQPCAKIFGLSGWRYRNGSFDLHHIIPLFAWPAGRMVTSNVLCVCRACHTWIHANIKRSYELGLLKRRERE